MNLYCKNKIFSQKNLETILPKTIARNGNERPDTLKPYAWRSTGIVGNSTPTPVFAIIFNKTTQKSCISLLV